MTQLQSLPLGSWHSDRGARMGDWRGFLAPLDYGDPQGECDLLATSVGLLDRSPFSRLEMLGEDRVRFLNGLVTFDLTKLEPGGGGYGFFTDRKGRVLADVAVWLLEDRLFLDLPVDRAKAVRSHLEGFVVADRVEVLPLDELIPLALLGPGVAVALGEAGEGLDLPWSHRKVLIGGSEVHLCRHERCGVEARVAFVSASIADLFAEQLVAEHGVSPVGFTAWERTRIEVGTPLWGVDFDGSSLPQETGLEEIGIAYDKGCYLGQEVVARLHYRGQVSRQLRRLRFPGGEAIEPGSALVFEDRESGTVTSAATDPETGVTTAIAMLARRAFEPGSEVEASGVRGTVELLG